MGLLHLLSRRATVAALAGGLLLALASAEPQASRPAVGAEAFLQEVEAAWQARDLSAWLALWDFAAPQAREAEAARLRSLFAADEASFTLVRRPRISPEATRFVLDARVFGVTEPRGTISYWELQAERRGDRWALVSRQDTGNVDGLVHVTLGPRPWRARDVSLHLEDFDLQMEDGTLFSSPEQLGPTAFVFVGRARVRFSPAPLAEREQLRQFSKRPAIDREVKWAFFRLHPAAFNSVLDTEKLLPEPHPEKTRAEAERIFRARVERSYLLDADLPRSPWWLMPSPGDAVVDFPWGGKHVLTLAVASNEPEDINLFERDRHLQICSYPSGGRPARYSDDDGRAADVLHHDMEVRFDPSRFELRATHAMRLKLVAPTPTLRLRLHEDLRVLSITSEEGGSHLFFRVRGQDSLVVSLGVLARSDRPFTLITRYLGAHNPAPVDREIVQLPPPPVAEGSEPIFLEKPPLVYSNRTAWYPHPANEDYATARLVMDTPEGWLGVGGGDLVSERTADGRTRAEYRLEAPGKFLTAVVGRLADVGLRQLGDQAVRGFAGPRVRGETVAQTQAAEEMLAFYAERYGPSPYPRVGLVVAEGEIPGGHSPPGLLYLQIRPPMLRSRSLPDDPANFGDLPGFFLAHETAHQWWGQGTAPANPRERWLSEAWAQYSAALWVRERLGEGAFRRMMGRMARWAQRDDEAGPIHLGPRLGHLKRDPRIFRAVVYDKGAWVLHMLRGLIGDEAFFGGARAFLEGHRYAKAGTEDLREAFERTSGRDLSPYFERWVYGTGLPELRWTARTAREPAGFRSTITVEAHELPGPLPLEIAAVTPDGREARTVLMDETGGSWSLETRRPPHGFEVNEDLGLLARVKRVRSLSQR